MNDAIRIRELSPDEVAKLIKDDKFNLLRPVFCSDCRQRAGFARRIFRIQGNIKEDENVQGIVSYHIKHYAWLTYEAFRAHKNGKPRFETWEQLHAHIGGEYGRLDNFRAKAKAALTKIKVVYPGLKLGRKQGGIEILPESYPALQSCNMTIDGTCTTL
jgi:hypothetical protein